MLTPDQFPHAVSDRLPAVASALVITVILMATAILPASPDAGLTLASTPFAMGVLA